MFFVAFWAFAAAVEYADVPRLSEASAKTMCLRLPVTAKMTISVNETKGCVINLDELAGTRILVRK